MNDINEIMYWLKIIYKKFHIKYIIRITNIYIGTIIVHKNNYTIFILNLTQHLNTKCIISAQAIYILQVNTLQIHFQQLKYP